MKRSAALTIVVFCLGWLTGCESHTDTGLFMTFYNRSSLTARIYMDGKRRFELRPGRDGNLKSDASDHHALVIRDAATGREIGARDRTTRITGGRLRIEIKAFIYDDRVDWDQKSYRITRT